MEGKTRSPVHNILSFMRLKTCRLAMSPEVQLCISEEHQYLKKETENHQSVVDAKPPDKMRTSRKSILHEKGKAPRAES